MDRDVFRDPVEEQDIFVLLHWKFLKILIDVKLAYISSTKTRVCEECISCMW